MDANYSQACQQMGYALLKKASEPMHQRLVEAVNFMSENMSDKNRAVLERAFNILHEGYANKEPDPYAKKFSEITTMYMKKQWEKDMIYYSICYDGFRV